MSEKIVVVALGHRALGTTLPAVSYTHLSTGLQIFSKTESPSVLIVLSAIFVLSPLSLNLEIPVVPKPCILTQPFISGISPYEKSNCMLTFLKPELISIYSSSLSFIRTSRS